MSHSLMQLTPGRASRRDVLETLAGAAALATLAGCGRPARERATGRAEPAGPLLSDPVSFSSATALARAIREQRLSSADVVDACLQRIEAVNPALNAVVTLDADGARRAARAADEAVAAGTALGPLHGVPMTIKDSFDTAGMVSTGGTLGRQSFVPRRDATVVARVRDAGAILLGKTNTPEFTLSFETDNLIFGRTNNPWDPALTSGGSSGGAAAIVAAGGAAFDIGSDYGGSIRLPAHFCGICGHKPTSGRVPRTGHAYPFGGVQDAFQQIGPLARTVDDLALLLAVVAGPDGVDPAIVPMPAPDPAAVETGRLRVSYHVDNGIRTPTPETIEAVRAAARALDARGLAVSEVRPGGVEETADLLPLYGWDGGAAVARLARAAGTERSSLDASGGSLDAVALDALVARWWSMRSRMETFFQDYDIILSPVNAGPAFEHGGLAEPGRIAAFTYTMTYNLTGWPVTVVRAGTAPGGLPIGVQVVARPWREDVSLAVAGMLESDLGPFPRPPL